MTTKEFKQVAHKENNFECFFDSDHNNQKNYRSSCAVWFCVPAMAKLQSKLGVDINTINASRLVVLMASKLGVKLDITDLNRSKDALTPKTAKADISNIKVNKELMDWIIAQRQLIENKPSYDQLRVMLREAGNSNELIDAHFNEVKDKPLTQEVAQIPKV